MDKISNDSMLAEVYEQVKDLSCDVKGIVNGFADMQQKVSNLAGGSNQPASPPSEKVEKPWLPLVIHEQRMHAVIQELQAQKEENAKLQARIDKAVELNKLNATSQYVKHFIRFLFMRRHALLAVIYVGLCLLCGIFVYSNEKLADENERLESNDWKWRYVAAQGFVSPKGVQALEDAYNHNDELQIDKVKKFVLDHEEKVRQKSDSIVRAERERLQRYAR